MLSKLVICFKYLKKISVEIVAAILYIFKNLLVASLKYCQGGPRRRFKV